MTDFPSLLQDYEDEAKVLCRGTSDPSIIAAAEATAHVIGGPRSEYIKYHKRSDV